MKRRALLQATAAAGVLLGGCLEADDPDDDGATDGDGSPTRTDGTSPTGTPEGGAGGDGSEDDGTGDDGRGDDGEATDGESTATDTSADATETPAETDAGTPTDDGGSGSNAVVDRSFEVAGTECGQGANRAAVTRGDDRVTVDGTIGGRNGCYTAELESATYDEGADELTVSVRSYDDNDGEACQQCIVDIDYRAVVEFEDGTPGAVTVVHDGDHVTTE